MFLGLSFSITADGEGLEDGIDQTIGLFDDLTDAVEEFSKETEKVDGKSKSSLNSAWGNIKKFGGNVNKMFDTMMKRVTQFNVADIASNIKSLTGETGNLTNGLEGQMVAMLQTTKPIVAELNVSSKEMKRISSQAASIAYSMNTDAGSVANTMKSMTLANEGAKKAMDAMGMSTRDWVKVVQTTGMDMQDYTAILGDMTTSWGASPEEAAKLIDTLVATGKAAGTGIGALKNSKVQLDELGNVFKTLPPSMARTSEEITGLMESSARMSGVFRMMGDTQSEAIEKGNTVARMFAEQDVAISKALAIGDDKALSENPLLKYMMQLGVGFDEARSIIATGSRDTVAGMQKINELYATMGTDKRAGVQRALADLSGALGEGASGLSYLAQNTDKGTAALKQMSTLVVKGDGALKQFGKDAFSSGLTLQDTYDRAREAFDTTIRSIARKNVRGLVKKQIAGMREAGQEIKALGSDETWGPLVGALSQFKQMGIGGLFASLAEHTGVGAKNSAKFGAKIGLVFDTIKGLGSEMAPLMQMIGMTGPLGPLLAAGGIGALLIMDDSTAKDILGPLYDTFNGLKMKIIGLWDEFAPKFLNIWSRQIKPKLIGFWNDDMVPVIKEFWNGTFIPFLKETIPEVGKALWGALKWAWGELGKQGGIIGQALAGAGGAAVLGLAPVGISIVASMTGPMMSLFSQVGMELLKVLNGPAGIVAIAGAAGIAFGSYVGDTLVQKRKLEDALSASKTLKKGGLEGMKYAIENDPRLIEEETARIKEAVNYASGRELETLRSALEMIRKAKSELNIERTMGADQYDLQGAYTEGFSQTIAMDELEMEGVLLGGQATATMFLEGVTESLEKGKDDIAASADDAASAITAHSPIAYGPLAGEGEANSAYNGGRFIMEQFAEGITNSVDIVKMAVEDALDASVITAFDEYSVKMQELAANKSLLLEVAKGMVQSMAVEPSDVEADVDVKKSFETAMSIPGIASVTLAVIQEGGKTRKMLKLIHTELTTQTSLMNGSSPPSAAGGKGAPVA